MALILSTGLHLYRPKHEFCCTATFGKPSHTLEPSDIPAAEFFQ